MSEPPAKSKPAGRRHRFAAPPEPNSEESSFTPPRFPWHLVWLPLVCLSGVVIANIVLFVTSLLDAAWAGALLGLMLTVLSSGAVAGLALKRYWAWWLSVVVLVLGVVLAGVALWIAVKSNETLSGPVRAPAWLAAVAFLAYFVAPLGCLVVGAKACRTHFESRSTASPFRGRNRDDLVRSLRARGVRRSDEL